MLDQHLMSYKVYKYFGQICCAQHLCRVHQHVFDRLVHGSEAS